MCQRSSHRRRCSWGVAVRPFPTFAKTFFYFVSVLLRISCRGKKTSGCKSCVKVVSKYQHAQVINRNVEQILDVPVPQTVEEIVNVPKIVPQERVQNRVVEQIVDVPVPQTVEEIVNVPKIVPQERKQNRM
eukprot:3425841-Amphidinium_carterae.1